MNVNLDLIVFGAVALFLILRLRSILGRRTGFERPEQPPGQPLPMPGRIAPIIEGRATPVAPAPARHLPDPASPAGQGLAAIRLAEPQFDPVRFLTGAEAAFRRIVTAFAAGERTALAPLLTEETFTAFTAAIAAREAQGETQISEIKSVLDAVIEQVHIRPSQSGGSIADIVVRFVSHQTNLVKDKAGAIISGSDGITELADIWGFERVLGSTEPTWRLASAQSA